MPLWLPILLGKRPQLLQIRNLQSTYINLFEAMHQVWTYATPSPTTANPSPSTSTSTSNTHVLHMPSELPKLLQAVQVVLQITHI